MMQMLRDNTHIVMIILVISFVGLIVLEWGMDLTGTGTTVQNYVGEINGEKIRYDEMRRAYEQLRDMERQQRGTDLDAFTHRRLIQQVWDQRVTYTLMQQEIVKRNITVSDAELIEAIRENPPDYMRQQELFLTDGKFDQAKYLAALPSIQGLEFIEAQYREMLPQQKLVERVTSVARVTDLEVRNAYVAQNEKVTVKYVAFNASDHTAQEIDITDEEIEAYYREHQKDFEQEERAKLAYVLINKKPSAADEARVERQINNLYQQIVDGADFETLAGDFSEDPSAANGGDLGFFGRGAMVKEFEDAAFATSVGEVAEPVKTTFGWHIIKVEEKKQEQDEEQVRARHILLKTTIGQQTLSTLQAHADTLLSMATAQNDLQAVADAESLEVLETSLFPKRSDGYIPRIGYVSGASTFAFNENEGAISDVLENDTGFFILRIVERRPAGVQPLDEVKDRITNTLQAEKRKDLAQKAGEAFLAKLGGQKLDALTGADLEKVKTPDAFSRTGFIPSIGREIAFIGAAFKLKNPGDMSGLVEGDRGYYLIQLVAKAPIDETAFEREKDNYRQQLLAQKQTQVYNEWLARLRDNAEIVNRMSDFFIL